MRRLIPKFLFILILSWWLLPHWLLAAQISLEAEEREFGIGEQIEIKLNLSSEESINALEGKIIFPASLLELKEINDGNSLVNFWVERPGQDGETIIFSGISPGGWQGNRGFIFSLILEAKNEGQGMLEIKEARVLLNDGQGTAAPLSVSSFQFAVSGLAKEKPIIIEKEDIEPPETFKPEISRDPLIFEGKWFLVFATQDKGRGISHYEVKERREKVLTFFSKWEKAESPYVLKDQGLKSETLVKAIDRAGQERIIKIPAQRPLAWYKNYENWFIILIGVVFIFFILRARWRKYSKSRKLKY